jgi:pimeloyl-ACP methyl ester carboxylesterase
MTSKKPSLNEYIVPLNINGLRGRMLKAPASGKGKREILFIYGHHAALERVFGFVEDLQQYGNVTVPDLPGFGGMDSYYKLKQVPTLDNMADYLAAFVKLRYNGKRISIIGMSYGFVIATRMLQRYPELADKTDLMVSLVGFSHKDDLAYKKFRFAFYRYGAQLFTARPLSLFFRNVCLHPAVLKRAYAKTHNAKKKFEGMDKATVKQFMEFEVYLWHCNDVRTWFQSIVEFMTLDNCKKQLDVPFIHITVGNDRYLREDVVEQHLRIIFRNITIAESKQDQHMPSVIASAAEAKSYFPDQVRSALARA